MSDPYFFGYGSLVNRTTHVYDQCHTARLSGWKRTWRHTTHHPSPYLTAVPANGFEIDGLIAAVPAGDWASLDARENGYDRVDVQHSVRHPLATGTDLQVYTVPTDKHPQPPENKPILLSYLDVVVQGYLREFGPAGVIDFFETTDGWDAPFLNDRTAPHYPRHKVLCASETALVDDWLTRLSAQVQKL